MALTVTITNAGRAELINAQNTGTTAAVIDRIGVSSTHVGGDLKTLTVLPNERKRLSTFGGEVVADDVIHVTINDETADTYTLRAFGLYFSSGTLFAVCTSAEPIMEKAAAAMLLQAVDITLTTLDTANIAFGGTGFTNPPATTERMGVVELATAEETIAGTDAVRAVTPYGLARAFAAWAANFAAKIHNHGIGDITDLGTALAGKAPKIHDHDAADTKTGVFAVDRIPKLPISWITNLTETLADKASALHSHTMAQVSGLIAALAAKSDRLNPVFQGTMRTEGWSFEMPSLGAYIGMNLSYSDNWRRRDGGEGWVQRHSGGSFEVSYAAAGEPGSVAALQNVLRLDGTARQAYIGGNLIWTAANFDPATKANANNAVLTGTSRIASYLLGEGRAYVYSEGDAFNVRVGPAGAEHWLSMSVDGYLYINGNRVWDPRKFNPDTKANVQNPDFYGQFNLESGPTRTRMIGDGDSLFIQAGTATSNNGNLILSGLFGQNLTSLRTQIGGALRDIYHTGNLNAADLVKISATNLGRTGSAPVANFTSAVQIGDLPTGYSAIFPGGTFGMPPLPGYYFKVGRRDHSSGWGAVVVGHAEAEGQAVDAYVGAALAGTSTATWSKIWTTKNFSPSTKVDIFNTDGYPHAISLGWNGSRMVARVDNAAATPGHALVHLADAASAAESATGTATDRFITPAALWSFAKSIGPNGHLRIPGTPMVMQWGINTASVPEGEVHVFLPTAFGGGCLFASLTPINVGPAYTMDYNGQRVRRYQDRIVMYANRANGSAGNMSGYEWFAIGLATGTPDPVYTEPGGGDPGGGGGGGGGGMNPEV